MAAVKQVSRSATNAHLIVIPVVLYARIHSQTNVRVKLSGLQCEMENGKRPLLDVKNKTYQIKRNRGNFLAILTMYSEHQVRF